MKGTNKTIGIIGAGNMAQALFRPLKNWFDDQGYQVSVFTPTKTRAQELATFLGGVSVDSLEEMNNLETIILAHKPQQLDEVASKLCLSKNTCLISLLAAIDVATLSTKFRTEHVLRLMPNTPVNIGKGVITSYCRSEDKDLFEHWAGGLKNISRYIVFEDEKMIDLTTPELGSGPGIVFELIRIFSDSLAQKGIDQNSADLLAASVFSGAGEMVLRSGDSPEVLRDKVTSRGGITAECLKSLNNAKITNIFPESFKAGHNRALEMK